MLADIQVLQVTPTGTVIPHDPPREQHHRMVLAHSLSRQLHICLSAAPDRDFIVSCSSLFCHIAALLLLPRFRAT